MQKSCRQCAIKFEITDDDLKFYDKISPMFAGKKYLVPPPTLCPECRQQRRLVFRNERTLYHRKCDLSGKQIISMHSPDKPYKVYDQAEWWSDKWDPLQYGRDFDFTKTLAEQLKSLYQDTPHVSLQNTNAENSYYTNFALNQKNCYLIFGAGNNEDCLYGKFIVNSKDVVDGLNLYSCEKCYEGVASDKCYNCKFFFGSRNCSDSIMIENCQSCRDCIGCFGLQSKQYYVFNKYIGKEKYQEFAKEYEYLTPEKIDFLQKKLDELKIHLPHRYGYIYGSENCSGDAIFNSKNCHYSFNIKDSEDSKYIYFAPKTNNTYDVTFCAPDGVSFCYNICSTVSLKSSMVNFYVWYASDIYYSIECHHSQNLFACISLKNKKYCILNKQYSKEEYEKLVSRIIEHMQKTGEWGEYFPYSLSPFGYNETIAQEYCPINKEEALKLGATWYDKKPEAVYQGENVVPPEDIRNVKDDICSKILTCEITGHHYKIIPQELKFYRDMNLPIPRKCPDQRHLERMKAVNPHRLWSRTCAKCTAPIQTTYAPERQEIVYCESCYLKEIY